MTLPDQAAVDAHLAAFDAELAAAGSAREAQAIRDKYLGRKNSVVASWMQLIAGAPPDRKKDIGRFANELKSGAEARWSRYVEAGAVPETSRGAPDVTLPGRVPPLGHRHPLTIVRDQLEDIFTRMGFAIVEGPEVEDEWHCFDALNMPAEHPARDMQDTLYLAPPLPGLTAGESPRTLLRTHTSSMQIRYMLQHAPPVRIVVPGRVYRRDDLDLTHSPAFGQIEGLAVGDGLSLADLKGTLLAFARQMFSPDTRVRFRPSFFPYTEPSAEIDLSCWRCDGKGCAMCKQTGWIELGGCGMVHPAVFEAVGYDAERYTGFAWGIGIERIAILRYQVEDIRLFFENDLRFLEQFPVLSHVTDLSVVSWLRDFVDVTVPPDRLAHDLGLRGFEVAALEPLGGDDAVIDFEVTANRPDCLSVLGLAREAATLYDLPLTRPSTAPGARIPLRAAESGESARLSVTIADADLCPRYAAAVAETTPGASPAWLADRLEAAGVRPISAIVDVTNYVLLELGHPMHAFDLERLAPSPGAASARRAEIRVRRASPGERLTTLDGIERTLDGEMLVIGDAERAQAVAGVMGGAASEVSDRTRIVALESAYFLPASVRRTSKRLNLKTEASARFERGADVNAPVLALQRALALLDQLGAGAPVGPIVDRYPVPREPRTIALRRERLGRLLGITVPDRDVERILRALGLSVAGAPDGWTVTAPTFRVDLLREADLIEEVGRHFGFDRLAPSFPVVTQAVPPPDPRVVRDRRVRGVMTAAGLSEAVTFAFIESKAAAPFAELDTLVSVVNPLSAKFETLRPSLLPGLVDAVAHNRRHGRRDVALFEIGERFTTRGETRAAAAAWTGAPAAHWKDGARAVDLFDVTGLATRLAAVLDVDVRIEPAAVGWLVPGQSAAVRAGDRLVGIAGQVAPRIVDERGAPRQDAVFALEIDLDQLDAARSPHGDATTPLPRYPSVVRDLSIVVPETLPAATIHGTMRAAGRRAAAPLVSVTFFDRYQGKGVPDRSVSLSIRLTFQAPDRTLTDAEVQRAFDGILEALVREHGAVQR